MIKLRYILPILFFIPIAIIQIVIVPYLSLDFIVPDLIIILLLFFTLQNSQLYGTALGFILGLLFDFVSGSLIGIHMLAYTLSGFIAGYFYNENRIVSNIYSGEFLLIVLLCSTISSIANSFFTYSPENINLFYLIIDQGFLPGIYTALFALPVVFFKPGKRFL